MEILVLIKSVCTDVGSSWYWYIIHVLEYAKHTPQWQTTIICKYLFDSLVTTNAFPCVIDHFGQESEKVCEVEIMGQMVTNGVAM